MIELAVATFFNGLLAGMSACVFAVYPIILGYIMNAHGKNKGSVALFFILGMMISGAAIISLINIAGTFLADAISNFQSLMNIVAGIILLLFGMQFLGIMDSSILKKTFSMGNRDVSGVKGVILSGMLFGTTISPCNAGFIIATAALTFNAKLLGAIIAGIFFAFGMSMPMLIFSLFAEESMRILEFYNKHSAKMEIFSGVIMVLIAMYFAYTGFNTLII